ncbi:uncharacterized protein LOC123195065 [Mangifera indica]|uniref:uncharacterized protein LOC123195065 n=1 Tax=Mangifera indica TaxID=29780 RepID=UPI001CFB093D|nr:uncharacterized protein LOC123195065 [Mangifera indica]
MYNGIHLFLKSKSENPCHAVLVYDNQLSTCQTCGLPSLLWSIYLSHSKFSLSFDINNNNHPWSIRIYVTPHLLFPFSDWDPNLCRQLATFLTSSSFAEMGIRVCWCNMETDYRAVRLGQSCREIRPVKSSSTSGLAKFRWEVLWMKFKKEMKKMFEFVSPLQVPYYNSYTYSQNFDQGFAWEEPDNLSRSFSVRFADPSRRLLKKTEM